MREATWRGGLGEFSDCLLAGVLVALASVPVVTAAPALAAGCRAIERSGRGVGGPLWTTFWADFRAAARGGVVFGGLAVLAAVLFAVDLEVAGSLPGGRVLRPVLGVLAGVALVIAVRTCEVVATRDSAAVSPAMAGAPAPGEAGANGPAAARRGSVSWLRAGLAAARETLAAPGSAALLAGAILLSAVLVWMLPILAFVVPGPLCLAAVATGRRS
ncbi:DUF624 domain-containing protein [Amycolatopsis sp. cmx-4-83]|uniref:DUF624 domain-containing protein n=1 Tax=Amycolatopsis sp. cmx-4-83 TaxID=2790940 RepID=UPI00397966D3